MTLGLPAALQKQATLSHDIGSNIGLKRKESNRNAKLQNMSRIGT